MRDDGATEAEKRQSTKLWWKCFTQYMDERRYLMEHGPRPDGPASLRDVIEPFTPQELTYGKRALLSIGVGSLSSYVLSTKLHNFIDQRSILRGASPVGKLPKRLFIGLQAILGGVIGFTSYSWYHREYAEPFHPQERHCPAFAKMEPCAHDKYCVAAARRNSMEFLIDSYHFCKDRAATSGDKSARSADSQPQ